MMSFGTVGRDWLLGALQEHLQFSARVAEHYREQLYDRLSDIERVSEHLDGDDAGETHDKRPRRGERPPPLHDRWLEARRYAANWWEDHLRLRAQQIDSYIQFLRTRTDRLRELREANRGEVERTAPKTERRRPGWEAATPDEAE